MSGFNADKAIKLEADEEPDPEDVVEAPKPVVPPIERWWNEEVETNGDNSHSS